MAARLPGGSLPLGLVLAHGLRRQAPVTLAETTTLC